MLEKVLISLAHAFNTTRAADATPLQPSRLFDDARKPAFPANTLAISLVSVARDGVMVRALATQQHAAPMRWDVRVVVAAHDEDFGSAMRDISEVLAFFSANALLNHTTDALRVRVVALTLEEQHHLWSTLGGRALPAVVLDVGVVDVGVSEADVTIPRIAVEVGP